MKTDAVATVNKKARSHRIGSGSSLGSIENASGTPTASAAQRGPNAGDSMPGQ